MLEQHILEPSTSPWGAPYLLLKRKTEYSLQVAPRLSGLEFPGYVISEQGREPASSKIAAVASFARPTCKSDVQKFLGLTGYYREHIPNFAATSFNLGQLLKNQVTFRWGNQDQKEFDTLKRALCSDKVLPYYPNWNHDLIVQTDASSKGLGAVLSQIGPDNKEHPVGYASRAQQPPKSKWTTREQELLAVIWACETFYRYLWGRKLFIQTDHANLHWLQAVSTQKRRLARWAMRLAEYDFELQHPSGKNNGNADALSRCPITSCATSTESTCPLDVDNLIAANTLAVFKANFAVEVDLFSNLNSSPRAQSPSQNLMTS